MKVEAALAFATRDSFTLSECEELAKDLDAFNSMAFDLVGPKGRKAGKWIDAYYGMFELDGKMFHSAQFKYINDLRCENLAFPEKEDSDSGRNGDRWDVKQAQPEG